jgi:integrase
MRDFYLITGELRMKQAKTLTAQELRRVLDHIATRKHAARNRAMLLITHYAGLRVAEMASLRFADVVDAEGAIKNEIMLRPEQTKGGYARTVFISEKLKKELAAYIKVFTPKVAMALTPIQPPSSFTIYINEQQFQGRAATRVDVALLLT